MFDLDVGVWVKPSAHTKQRREHRIPLSAAAIELLKELKRDATTPFLFPGANGKPLTDIKRTWLAVCRKAGLAERVPKKTRNGRVVHGKNGAPFMAWQATA